MVQPLGNLIIVKTQRISLLPFKACLACTCLACQEETCIGHVNITCILTLCVLPLEFVYGVIVVLASVYPSGIYIYKRSELELNHKRNPA